MSDLLCFLFTLRIKIKTLYELGTTNSALLTLAENEKFNELIYQINKFHITANITTYSLLL